MLITDGLFRHAATRPNAVAIQHGARAVTCAELAAVAERMAGALAERLPVDEGPLRVGLLLDRASDLLVAMLGVNAAGHVAIPYSTEWAGAELAAVIEQSTPALTITDRAGLPDSTTLAALLEHPSRNRPRTATPDEPFYVGYTSGSTGMPRGAVRSHRAWTSSFHLMTLEFGIGPGDRVVIPGSLYFSFALNAAMHAVFSGATAVFPAEPGPRGVLAELRGGPVGVLYALPSVLGELGRLAATPGHRWPPRLRVITAGERLDPAVAALVREVFPGIRLFQYYGASELGYVTVLRPEDFEGHADSIGRPALGVRLAILGEDGSALPPGDIGVLAVHTPFGFSGYLGDPRGSEVIAFHGWRTVGDLAWIDGDGYVHLAGRRDNMVVLRGQNVYPEVVEQVLRSIPGVRQAVAVPAPVGRPRHLVAVVELANEVPASTILDHAKAALSGPRVPRRVVAVREIPRTATGKVDRRAAAALIG